MPEPLEGQLAAAEQRAAELESQLAETARTLEETRAAQTAAERSRSIERELIHAGAADLETASLLINTRADSPDKSIPALVAELKQKKPFLFTAQPITSAMSGHAAPANTLTDAATHARQSGDRRALLSYLRLRREQ